MRKRFCGVFRGGRSGKPVDLSCPGCAGKVVLDALHSDQDINRRIWPCAGIARRQVRIVFR